MLFIKAASNEMSDHLYTLGIAVLAIEHDIAFTLVRLDVLFLTCKKA